MPTAGSFALGLGTLPRDWDYSLATTAILTKSTINVITTRMIATQANHIKPLMMKVKNREDNPEHKEEHK